jgi:hypothetical protein
MRDMALFYGMEEGGQEQKVGEDGKAESTR